jgi:flavodoxin I
MVMCTWPDICCGCMWNLTAAHHTGNHVDKIGIFFGTDSGTTRLIAKKMAKVLGPEVASKPLNVNWTRVGELTQYDALILGTPSYAEGALPGQSTGVKEGSWEEFLPLLENIDLTGKVIALYGLGDQEKYPQRFADALMLLYSALKKLGADIVGEWSTEGYDFKQSKSVIGDKFVGLVIDHGVQGLLTDERINIWLEQVKPALLGKLKT